MTKLDEIMNGEHEIKRLRIEGDTIGFDTEQDNNWNLTPRDIEYIIYNLQRTIQELKATNQRLGEENDKLFDNIEAVRDYVEEMCMWLEKGEKMYMTYGDDLSPKHIIELLDGDADGSNK